jgi:PmbA protein
VPELQDLADRVVGWAREGEEVEAYVARSRDTSVRIYSGEIESLSTAESEGVGIRVIRDSRVGFAYAGSLEASVVEEALAEARDNAGFSSPDPHVGLARPDGVERVELDLWREDVAATPTPDKVALAQELERLARAGDGRVRQIHSSDYGDGASEVAIASTAGIRGTQRRTGCHLAVEVLAGEGEDTQTGVGYSVGRGFSDLDVSRAAQEAVERAVRMLGARKAPSSRLPVVFDKRVTTSLLGILSGTFSGEAVLKGRSLFARRLGESVAHPSVTLVDDPTLQEAYAASAQDAEGLATRPNVLIDGGVARSFLYDSYNARRAGTTSTGSAVRGGFKSGPGVGARALSLVPGDKDLDAVLATVGTALFVQGIQGIHSGVNPVSGDFSVGAEGLMVRDGQLAEPVREITIASTLQRMLLEVLEIGSDLEWLPGTAAGLTLAIDGLSVSGS